jgi:hypothetical protein
MNRLTALALAAASVLIVCGGATAGSLVAPAGYVCTDTPIDIPTDGWFGGFDFLPNGNLVISDGYSVREITRAGAPVRTLYTYADPDPSTPDVVETTFGSFVRYNPGNDRVYFGESTFGTVRWTPLAGGADTLVATLAWNYDMDIWNNVPYVVAGNKVYRVNETTGTVEAVATAGGPSGPVIFDAVGNLIYGTGDYDWSTPNDQNIFMWTSAQVAGAGSGNVLTTASATTIGANVNGPGGFALNGLGELLYTDSVGWPASIKALRNGVPETFAETYVPGQYPWTTALRFDAATGDIAAAISWSVYTGGKWVTSTVISTLTPAAPVPEPSSLIAVCSLIGLAASSKLLRLRGE